MAGRRTGNDIDLLIERLLVQLILHGKTSGFSKVTHTYEFRPPKFLWNDASRPQGYDVRFQGDGGEPSMTGMGSFAEHVGYARS